jgi:hypothetical protein
MLSGTTQEAFMRVKQAIFYMSKAILAAIEKAILAVLMLIAKIFGGKPPAMPSRGSLPTTTDDVADTYRDSYTREVANDHAMASDIGMAVHQYATAGDPGVRCAVDLEGLDLDQMGWLLSLSDGDLAKLATAGPKACELAVTGKRCGIVGLPTPQVRPAVVVDKAEAVRSALVHRVGNVRRPQLAA